MMNRLGQESGQAAKLQIGQSHRRHHPQAPAPCPMHAVDNLDTCPSQPTMPPTMPHPSAPATSALSGTPASASARLPPHTAAMEELPAEASVSALSRRLKGKSSRGGMTGSRARSARSLCPISRRCPPAGGQGHVERALRERWARGSAAVLQHRTVLHQDLCGQAPGTTPHHIISQAHPPLLLTTPPPHSLICVSSTAKGGKE